MFYINLHQNWIFWKREKEKKKKKAELPVCMNEFAKKKDRLACHILYTLICKDNGHTDLQFI